MRELELLAKEYATLPSTYYLNVVETDLASDFIYVLEFLTAILKFNEFFIFWCVGR
ncbi:hypothetical protein MCEMSE6_02731 [Oxalobacteraceae bacterium]